MRVTVAESVTRLCPLLAGKVDDKCFGPGCMAWRWSKPTVNKVIRAYSPEGRAQVVDEPARPAYVPATWVWTPWDKDDDSGSCWLEPDEDAEARRTGFCGLAGVPDHD